MRLYRWVICESLIYVIFYLVTRHGRTGVAVRGSNLHSKKAIGTTQGRVQKNAVGLPNGVE